MKKLVDLSFPIHEGMMTFPVPWHPIVEITQLGRHCVEGRESRKIVFGSHTGTHVDAPVHFIPNGKSINEIPLDTFIGPCSLINLTHLSNLSVIDLPEFKRILPSKLNERVVLFFGWSQNWEQKNYYKEHPSISEETALWLVNQGIKLIGMDTPQADSPLCGCGSSNDSPIHKILLGNDVIKLEYLCNLDKINVTEFELIALPMNIKDSDGSPVRAIARF